MIPSRPVQAVEHRKQSVSERLARLRAEQTARERPRFSASTHASLPKSANARWLEAATNAARQAEAHTLSRPVDRRRGTAGPPAPKSWSTGPSELGELPTRHHSDRSRVDQLAFRAHVTQPLVERDADTPSPKGLYVATTKVIAEDLSRGGNSLLSEFLDYLPLHLRLRILDVYADWRNELVLTDDVLRILLSGEAPHQESAVGMLDDGGAELVAEGVTTILVSDSAQFVDDADDDWESSPWAGSGGSEETVESLDLSFSVVTLKTLRSVLLRDSEDICSALPTAQEKPKASSTLQVPSPVPKQVAIYPGLHTLNLTSTNRIPFSDVFLDTLSHLISLRHLSLNAKSLSASSGATSTSVGFIARLAAATPNLQTLDLSYMDLDLAAIARSLDWNERWLDLRVLGVRSDSDGLSSRRKERLKRDIQEAVASSKRRKRRWVDVVT